MVKQSISLLITFCSFISFAQTDYGQLANQYHLDIVTPPEQGIGAREAGTKEEKRTAEYIIQQLSDMGYQVTEQDFSFGKKQLSSKNIIVNTNTALKKTIVLGAHYDSTAKDHGSLGATDNGAGIAALLAIAKAMKSNEQLAYNIRFIAFGAEEVGLKGAKHYVSELSKNQQQLDNIIAMINFDTIAGGDFTYVHSAHTKPYQCDLPDQEYNSDKQVRDALLAASKEQLGKESQYVIHPDYPGYPEGVTGSWSDHAPFACAGIPIAYVESTNFTINGKDGFDGYSQTTNPKLWDCFDDKNITACDRATEKKWGNIWHTEFDRIDRLEALFPGRISKQIADNVQVLIALLSNFNDYVAVKN